MIPKSVEILNSLRGQLLVAMPHMDDPRFKQAVIMMCQSDKETAMGLMLNKIVPDMDLNKLRSKLKLKRAFFDGEEPVYQGGPVESGRGFVLHSSDQMLPDSLPIGEELAMSVQISMINEIAAGTGPKYHRIMLGYAGWDKGQIEKELRDGMWFHISATSHLIFETPVEDLWKRCYHEAGFDAARLSPQAGSA
ncbi:MAG: YqgE/AlgH family protein [Candidatus Puniceispirillaceae bacterium]